MEPQNPSLIADPDPEEPIEAADYYDAMREGWLDTDLDEDGGEDLDPVELPME